MRVPPYGPHTTVSGGGVPVWCDLEGEDIYITSLHNKYFAKCFAFGRSSIFLAAICAQTADGGILRAEARFNVVFRGVATTLFGCS